MARKVLRILVLRLKVYRRHSFTCLTRVNCNLTQLFFSASTGFDVPSIECASPLGMENDKIPNSAITASSRYNQYWGPERGRLNQKPEGKYVSHDHHTEYNENA